MPDPNKDVKQLTGATSKFSSISSPRLTSFHGARDLSLAGPPVKGSKLKRVFKPNIVARKTKNERAIDEALKIHGKTSKKSEQAAYKGKTQRKGKELIQMKGSLFDEIGLSAHKSRQAANASKMIIESRPFDQMQIKVDPDDKTDNSDNFLSQLSRNDNIDDNTFDTGLPPFIICKKKEKKKKVDFIDSFQQLKVKLEPLVAEDTNVEIDVQSNLKEVADVLPKMEMSLGPRLLNGTNNDLVCFSLPGALPGVLQCEEKKVLVQDDSTELTELGKFANSQIAENRFCINQVQPGQIGTLQVFKSGKVEVTLNDIRFEALNMLSGGYHEELALVQVDEDKKSGRLSVLGNISSNYSLVPKIEVLMPKKEEKLLSPAS